MYDLDEMVVEKSTNEISDVTEVVKNMHYERDRNIPRIKTMANSIEKTFSAKQRKHGKNILVDKLFEYLPKKYIEWTDMRVSYTKHATYITFNNQYDKSKKYEKYLLSHVKYYNIIDALNSVLVPVMRAKYVRLVELAPFLSLFGNTYQFDDNEVVYNTSVDLKIISINDETGETVYTASLTCYLDKAVQKENRLQFDVHLETILVDEKNGTYDIVIEPYITENSTANYLSYLEMYSQVKKDVMLYLSRENIELLSNLTKRNTAHAPKIIVQDHNHIVVQQEIKHTDDFQLDMLLASYYDYTTDFLHFTITLGKQEIFSKQLSLPPNQVNQYSNELFTNAFIYLK